MFIAANIRSTSYATVILSNPSTSLLHAVSAVCWEHNTPFVVIRTCGLLGYMRLQLREQHVTSSAADLYDLRIFNPFPELHDYCTGFNLSELSDAEHAHVPYIVILYQALQRWKSEHGGLVPLTYADKKMFAAGVQSMARKKSMEVNFEEALNNSFRSYAPIRIPEQITQLMSNMDSVPSQGISEFRLLLTALKVYMERHGGQVPLPGNIPDMTSTSECFIQLQQRYHKKAEADREEVREIVSMMSGQLGRADIPAETVDLFCRSVYALGFIENPCPIAPHGVDVTDERKASEAERVSNIIQQYFGDPYEDTEQTPIVWWFLILAAEEFQSRHGKWPGAGSATEPIVLEQDTKLLWDCIQTVVAQKIPVPPRSPVLASSTTFSEPETALRPLLEHIDISDLPAYPSPDIHIGEADISMKRCREMVRFGDSVLHNIASVMGGVASQVKTNSHCY